MLGCCLRLCCERSVKDDLLSVQHGWEDGSGKPAKNMESMGTRVVPMLCESNHFLLLIHFELPPSCVSIQHQTFALIRDEHQRTNTGHEPLRCHARRQQTPIPPSRTRKYAYPSRTVSPTNTQTTSSPYAANSSVQSPSSTLPSPVLKSQTASPPPRVSQSSRRARTRSSCNT